MFTSQYSPSHLYLHYLLLPSVLSSFVFIFIFTLPFVTYLLLLAFFLLHLTQPSSSSSPTAIRIRHQYFSVQLRPTESDEQRTRPGSSIFHSPPRLVHTLLCTLPHWFQFEMSLLGLEYLHLEHSKRECIPKPPCQAHLRYDVAEPHLPGHLTAKRRRIDAGKGVIVGGVESTTVIQHLNALMTIFLTTMEPRYGSHDNTLQCINRQLTGSRLIGMLCCGPCPWARMSCHARHATWRKNLTPSSKKTNFYLQLLLGYLHGEPACTVWLHAAGRSVIWMPSPSTLTLTPQLNSISCIG